MSCPNKVIKEKTKVTQLIQVCYSLQNPKTKHRELMGILEASKTLNCKNLLIVTEDIEGNEIIKGNTIHFIPLWKWLLS